MRPQKGVYDEETLLRYRWAVLAVLFLLQFTCSGVSFSFGPLAPFLKDGLGLSRAQVGMFTSAIYLGYILMAIPWGRLADSIGPRKVMLVAPLLQGIAYLGFSQAPSFVFALLAVFIAGVGYGAVTSSTVKGLVYWFPARMRATAIGIKQTGAPVGGALCALALPALTLAFTWRVSAAAVGFAVIASAIICFLIYREFPRQGLPGARVPQKRGGLVQVLKNRDIMLVSFISIVYGMVEFSMTTYLVLYIKETFLFTAVVAGTFLALAQVCGGSGRILWGVISDRLMGGRRREVLILLGIVAASMLLVLSLWAARMPTWLLYVTVAVLGVTGMGWLGVHLTLVSELAGRELAATGSAVSVTISCIGNLIGPPLFGYLVDVTQSYTLSLRLLGFCTIAAALLLLLVRERKEI
jgi:ACS family hexuronate transporter-like MFS transporter